MIRHKLWLVCIVFFCSSLLIQPVSGLQTDIHVTSTVLWEINQEWCPPDTHCEQVWRITPDHLYLYAYIRATNQLYVIDTANQVVQYDLTHLEGVGFYYFDFIPLDGHTILYLNAYNGLYDYDLSTGQSTQFAPAFRPTSCTNVPNYLGIALMRFGTQNRILACGFGSTTGDDPLNISVIDLTTQEVSEVLSLCCHYGRVDAWRRITAGHNNRIYLELWSHNLVRTLEPNYEELYPDAAFYLEYDYVNDTWDVIAIPHQAILDSGGLVDVGTEISAGQLVGADAESNVYLYRIWYDGTIAQTRTQYIKANAAGEIKWILHGDEIGILPIWLDVTPDGRLLTVDFGVGGANSTLDVRVMEHTIESVP